MQNFDLSKLEATPSHSNVYYELSAQTKTSKQSNSKKLNKMSNSNNNSKCFNDVNKKKNKSSSNLFHVKPQIRNEIKDFHSVVSNFVQKPKDLINIQIDLDENMLLNKVEDITKIVDNRNNMKIGR